MTWPASNVNTTNLDAGTDSPQLARDDLLDLSQKFNQLSSHVNSFMQGLLGSADAATARATLDVPTRAGGNASGSWGISITGTAATATNLTRSVSASGLATGGGVLNADRTIAVPIASQAQAEAGSDNATAMTPLRVEQHMAANDLGWGQTYTDVKASRAASTSYQNTTGRPIVVAVTGIEGTATNGRSFEVSANGSTWLVAGRVGGNNNTMSSVAVVIPPGWYYRVNGSLSSITAWVELV